MFFSFLTNSVNKKWWVLAALSISVGLTYIDQTAVAIALPKIQLTFNLSPILLQWVMNAYLLFLALFLILGGRLGDLFQHHRVFTVGLIIFLFASIACAIAFNTVSLLISRAVQGFGAALMLPNSAVIIINIFGMEEKGKAMGIFTGSALLFLPLALLIGGIFTQYFTWRLIFWINLPLVIICLIIMYHAYDNEQLPNFEKYHIDWQGLSTLIIAIFLLVFALMEAGNQQWSPAVIIEILLTSAVFFIVCYYIEKYKDKPIIDFSIFHNKLFLSAIILFFSLSISTPLFIYDAIFYQKILDFEAAGAGILFFPNIFCIIVSAPIGGRLMDKYGFEVPVLSGLVLLIIGLFLKGVMIPFQNFWYLLPGIICINLGTPFIFPPITAAALSSFDQEKRGIASGISSAIRQISHSIALAVFTILFVGINRYLLNHYLGTNRYVISIKQLENLLIHSPTSLEIENVNPQQLLALHEFSKSTYAFTFSIIHYICAVFIAMIFIITLGLFKNIRINRISNSIVR